VPKNTSIIEIKKAVSTFDDYISKPFQEASNIHWTPAEIVIKAVEWLSNSSNMILDIGSGVGKFCIIGASISKAHFTGVEIRKNLLEEAKKVSHQFRVQNISFLNKDIIDVSFYEYDAFYYYNPFCEHIATADWIDRTIDFSEGKLKKYEKHIQQELANKPKGTRVVTYRSPNFQLPESYLAVEILEEGVLVYWEKTR